MVNNLQLFKFEGKEVRTLKINDEPYFVGMWQPFLDMQRRLMQLVNM